VIHNEWHPIPGRIKDFIAIPRPNLYQSLHTSVIGPAGVNFEIQIRTDEMHRIAEEGIAAHWKYKEGRRGPGVDDQRIAWLRQLVEWQREMDDPGEFLSTLKVDLYPEEVYCFTPRGRVLILPREATPIDFAYAIHTDVGHQCVGAKVNGRIVPLRSPLKNGDVVEIITQSEHRPSKDWLALVKTSRARNKIRQVINASERERAIDIGQKALEKEARRLGVSLSRVSAAEWAAVASDYGCSKLEDLHAVLGYGRISARQVLGRFAPAAEPEPPPKPQVPPAGPLSETGDLVLRVHGLDDMLVYRAKCCNPIRGEPITGYITRGKGVAVHSLSCPNVQSLMYEVDRRIEVEWARATDDTFPVKMIVYTEDRPGVLNQLTSILTHENSNIRSLEARADDKRGGESAIVDMTVEIRDKKQLDRIVSGMRRIPGIRDVERTQ
jgi:GTP pyrophosphokinase